MWLITFCAGVFVVLYSFVVVNRYFSFKLHKNTFPLTLIILLFNMGMLLFTAYLLPLDIFYAAKSNSSDPLPPSFNNTSTSTTEHVTTFIEGNSADVLPRHNFRVAWLIIYWLEFALCWFIIPVLISYITLKYSCAKYQQQPQRSHIWKRMTKAIYQNLKFYSLCLLGLIIGMIYLIASTGHGLGDFKPLLISLSHLYSLSYTLILLSTGLIIVPKKLLSVGRLPSNESVNKLFVELSKTNDDLNDSQLNMLENAEKILHTPESGSGDVSFNQMLNECKLEVQSILNELELSLNDRFSGSSTTTSITTLDKLNNHYNNFITHYYNYLYSQTHSNLIIHTLAQSQSTTISASSSTVFNFLRSTLMILLGITATALSMLIIFLETMPTKWGHSWVFSGTHWYNFSLEFTIFTYNTLVSLYAMSTFKFSSFHLIRNGRSNPTNALYYSLYSSRLLFPLCFNLMILIPSYTDDSNTQIKSSFETTLYHNLTVIPLADYLNRYLPTLFIVFIIISYKYDLKQKVLLKILGEDYYYQFFGMMMYEPVPEADMMTSNDVNTNNFSSDGSAALNNRSRMDEDYEYSLQDGRYLFERASSNYDMSINNDTNSASSNNHVSYL